MKSLVKGSLCTTVQVFFFGPRRDGQVFGCQTQHLLTQCRTTNIIPTLQAYCSSIIMHMLFIHQISVHSKMSSKYGGVTAKVPQKPLETT